MKEVAPGDCEVGAAGQGYQMLARRKGKVRQGQVMVP